MGINSHFHSPLHLLMTVLALALILAGNLMAAEKKEDQVAISYYRSLAENGSADAQLVLGDIFRKGEGVAPDLIQAYAWYYLAAQQGVEEAITPMNDVLKEIPQKHWQKAKSLAEEYEKRFTPQN